jgi:hypothetical protein
MTAPKNPRITISPEAFRTLSVQAALNGKQPGDLASKLILAGCQEGGRIISSYQPTTADRAGGLEGKREKTSVEAKERPKTIHLTPEEAWEEIIDGNVDTIQTAGEPQPKPDDLSVYQKEKMDGKRTYHYWYAKWTENEKKKDVYIGSTNKIDQITALKTAREKRAKSLSSKK